MGKLHWERVPEDGEVRLSLWRARLPQGWLVASHPRGASSLTFVPDAGGQWGFDEQLSAEQVQESLVKIEDRLGGLSPPG